MNPNLIVKDIQKLREKSSNIDIKENLDIIVFNLKLILEQSNGLGLAAIQIGIPLKIAVIKLENGEKFVMYNAKVLEKEDLAYREEGCLSFPNKFVMIPRAKTILIENGDGKKYSFENLEAQVVQHELSHWNGELIIDYETQESGI